MTACAHCHRFAGGEAQRCLFPNSDVCRYEARKEDEVYAINDIPGLRWRDCAPDERDPNGTT